MKRAALVCFSACCLLAGCKGQSTVADPFLPATRIPPPPTGAATGFAPATPYYAPSTGASAVGPPVVTPGGSYVPPPTVGYGASLNQPPSVYQRQASPASTSATGALGARPATIGPAAAAPASGYLRPNTSTSPGWTGAPATNSRDDLLTTPPASTRYASQTTRAASASAAASSPQARQPHTGTVSIPETARTTAPEPRTQASSPAATQTGATQAGATTSAPRAAVQQATEITDLPTTRPLDGRRPKGFQSSGA